MRRGGQEEDEAEADERLDEVDEVRVSVQRGWEGGGEQDRGEELILVAGNGREGGRREEG